MFRTCKYSTVWSAFGRSIVLSDYLRYTLWIRLREKYELFSGALSGCSMTFEELVSDLRDTDVRIYDDGNALRLRAPRGVITPQLLEIITSYAADLLYLVRLGDVRVCPARMEHRPHWRYSSAAHAVLCAVCRKEDTAA
jgi:hypothetical protein